MIVSKEYLHLVTRGALVGYVASLLAVLACSWFWGNRVISGDSAYALQAVSAVAMGCLSIVVVALTAKSAAVRYRRSVATVVILFGLAALSGFPQAWMYRLGRRALIDHVGGGAAIAGECRQLMAACVQGAANGAPLPLLIVEPQYPALQRLRGTVRIGNLPYNAGAGADNRIVSIELERFDHIQFRYSPAGSKWILEHLGRDAPPVELASSS